MTDQETIFFIEDDPHFLEEATEALTKEGFRVRTASDGEAGLALFDRERPDLVLLDLILPKQDGFEVLKTIKKNPDMAGVPVIVLTNLEGVHAVDRAILIGATSYLVKTGYKLEEVAKRVGDTLRKASPSS